MNSRAGPVRSRGMTSQTDSRFTQIARAESHPSTEPPAAASAGALADRRELAFIAVERTRMPMVVTDPRQPDHPIVLANQAFLELGGYRADEVVGRNCRFMQGPGTDPRQIDKIRQAICDEQEVVVELLNYKKDGSTFWNELFLSPSTTMTGGCFTSSGRARTSPSGASL
jgi:PAS domain S-box-containing protein